MTQVLKEVETRANRSYLGGKLIDRFLGKEKCQDCYQPEDWISSFTEARNKNYIKNEGITRVLVDGEEKLITEVAGPEYFGENRTDAGVLVKLLDSAERLAIQVHPTKEYAKKYLDSPYGKTECWHILDTREEGGCIYIGFKEYVTREKWKQLFETQDIQGMLDAMHRFEVKKGDTILVTGGTPHAIGSGCFLLEIQEPTDYTMLVEKLASDGTIRTGRQIHYDLGEDRMLDCFSYIPRTEAEIRNEFFLKPRVTGNVEELVCYEDTVCFALKKVHRGSFTARLQHFITIVVTADGGVLKNGNTCFSLKQGEKYFVPAETEITLQDAEVLLCYPPEHAAGQQVLQKKEE